MKIKTKLAALAFVVGAALTQVTHGATVYNAPVNYTVDKNGLNQSQTLQTTINIGPNSQFLLTQVSGKTGVGSNYTISNAVGISFTPSPWLALGTTIGTATSFFGTINTTGWSGTDQTIGIALTQPSGVSPIYGWLRLDARGSGGGHQTLNIESFYETTGAPVSTGSTTLPVPEPSSLALLGLGGAGLFFRRRRA